MSSASRFLITHVFLLVTIVVCSAWADWTVIDGIPHPHFLTDLRVLSRDSIWCVGSSGAVSRLVQGEWKLEVAPKIDFTSIQIFDENNAVATGQTLSSYDSHGLVLQWDGSSWNTILEIPMSDLADSGFIGIWGLSKDNFFVCGDDGLLYRYSFGSWQKLETGTSAHLRGIWGAGVNDVYVIGVNSFFFQDTSSFIMHWNGVGWSVSYYRDDTELNSIIGFESGDVVAVGNSTGYPAEPLVLHWDGTGWSEEIGMPDEMNIYDIWGMSYEDCYLVGNHGNIVHKLDDEWIEMDSGVTTDIRSIHGSNGDVFALGGGAALLELDGDVWNLISRKTGGAFEDITGTGLDQIFLVGTTGNYLHDRVCTIVQWDGSVWNEFVMEVEGVLNAVAAATSDSAFAVGTNDEHFTTGIIVKWDGMEWKTVSKGIYHGFRDIWGISPNEYYAVGDEGLMLKWDGSTWISLPIPTSAQLTSVWGTSSSDLFVTAVSDDHPDSGSVLHWDGSSWTIIYEEDRTSIVDVWGHSSTDVYALSYLSNQQLQILHWDGTTMQVMAELGNSQYSQTHQGKLFGFDADDLYVILDDSSRGLIWHYNGATWEEVASPSLGTLNAGWGFDRHSMLFVGAASCRYLVEFVPESPNRDTGVRLSMPSTDLQCGDPFGVTAYLDNSGPPIENAPVFFLLDVGGALFFWPGWTHYSPPGSEAVDFQRIDVPTGTTAISVFPVIQWPDLGGKTMSDLRFYGAIVNDTMDAILGEIGMVEFEFGP